MNDPLKLYDTADIEMDSLTLGPSWLEDEGTRVMRSQLEMMIEARNGYDDKELFVQGRCVLTNERHGTMTFHVRPVASVIRDTLETRG